MSRNRILEYRPNDFFKYFLKISVSLILLYLIINQIQFEQSLKALSLVNPYYLVLAISGLGLNLYLQFRKWKLLCDHLLGDFTSKEIISSLLFGIASGILTPFRAGEFVGRKYKLSGVSISEVSLATLIDKLSTLLVALILGITSTCIFIANYFPEYLFTSIVISILTIVIVLFLFYAFNRTGLKFLGECKNAFICKIYKTIKILNSTSIDVKLKLLVFSVLFFLTYICQLALLISAFDASIDFIEYFYLAAMIMFIKSLIPSITIGDLGIREWAVVLVYSSIGVTEGAAFNASIFLFLINLGIPAIWGSLLIMRRK